MIYLLQNVYPRSIGGYVILFVQNGLTPIGVWLLRNTCSCLVIIFQNMCHKSTQKKEDGRDRPQSVVDNKIQEKLLPEIHIKSII